MCLVRGTQEKERIVVCQNQTYFKLSQVTIKSCHQECAGAKKHEKFKVSHRNLGKNF